MKGSRTHAARRSDVESKTLQCCRARVGGAVRHLVLNLFRPPGVRQAADRGSQASLSLAPGKLSGSSSLRRQPRLLDWPQRHRRAWESPRFGPARPEKNWAVGRMFLSAGILLRVRLIAVMAVACSSAPDAQIYRESPASLTMCCIGEL